VNSFISAAAAAVMAKGLFIIPKVFKNFEGRFKGLAFLGLSPVFMCLSVFIIIIYFVRAYTARGSTAFFLSDGNNLIKNIFRCIFVLLTISFSSFIILHFFFI
jgi:hypothetical protein